MKDADRQRIERCLSEFDAWRASGVKLKIYVQQRGEDHAHWRARLSWERRWRQMLAGTYAKPAGEAGVVRNTCRTPKSASDAPTFEITTTQNEKQKRALELIDQIKM